jgi:AcrR family transcriptional regulator
VRLDRATAAPIIVDAARNLFAERGYRGTSMEAIADAANISRSSVFWHFGSKQGLLRAVLGEVSRSWVEAMLEIGDGTRGLEAIRAALAVRRRILNAQPETLRMIELLITEAATSEPELLPLLVELERSLEAGFVEWVAEAIAAGELRRGLDARRTASVIVAALHGVIQQWLVDPEGHDINDGDDAVLELIDHLRA